MEKTNQMEDVQNFADNRKIAINQVGIKSLKFPIIIADNSKNQATVAVVNMYVSLPDNVKGTHMSRFVGILNEIYQSKKAISIQNFPQLLQEMIERLEAENGFIEMNFPFFINKAAPVSGVQSLLDYDLTFIGKINTTNGVDFTLKMVIPVTSLCPCSKKISEYGAHNQRSHVTVCVKFHKDRIANICIENLIRSIEKEASCELYSLLKRPDEKFITEKAYDNPKFVEDMVRDVAAKLNKISEITWFSVESENFESIHNHSAYAKIEQQK